MTPIRTQILFKPFPPEAFTEGGLIVPDSVKKPNNKGTIVKVGNGAAGRPMKLTPGQKAIRVQDWGVEGLVDGEQHFLMDMDSILAIENEH